jgi:TolA-binding protein
MLKPKRRLKRREIKEDKFVTFVAKWTDFFNENGKFVVMGVGGLALVIAIGYFMSVSKRDANLAASGGLIRATDFYNQNQFDEAIPHLQRVVDTYSGTANAGVATYYLANSYYSKENYSEAKRYFQLYLDNYGDNPLFVGSAYAGLGACHAVEGEREKAAQLYQKAYDENPGSFTAPEFLFVAARNYIEIAQKSKAIELLQKIVDDHGATPIANDAELLLAEISSKS